VDIMHLLIKTKISGRLFGTNISDNTDGAEGDRFSHLVDLYAST